MTEAHRRLSSIDGTARAALCDPSGAADVSRRADRNWYRLWRVLGWAEGTRPPDHRGVDPRLAPLRPETVEERLARIARIVQIGIDRAASAGARRAPVYRRTFDAVRNVAEFGRR